MNAKTRIQKLEKQKPVRTARREMSAADIEMHERSMNCLVSVLGCTRAELEKQLKELFNDKTTAKP